MKEMIFKGGLTKYWWIPMLTEIFAIAIGIWCLCSPTTSLPFLAYVFAALVTVAGAANICLAVTARKALPTWGWPLAMGIIEVICGIWLFALPQNVLTVTFIYIIGIYLIFAAVNSIVESCMLDSYKSGMLSWLLIFLFITLLFTVLYLAGPIAGGVAVWLYIGLSFISFGIFRLMLSAKIRRINREISF